MTRRRALLFAALGLLLLLFSSSQWVLRSEGGRDWVLGQIVASLPEGATLSWREVKGPLSGPIELRDVDYRQADGLRLQAARLRLVPQMLPLLRRRIGLSELQLEQGRLHLPRSDKPFEWPQWPQVLPAIDMPLSLSVSKLQILNLAVDYDATPVLQVQRATGELRLGPGELWLNRFRIDSDRGRLLIGLDYRPRENYRMAVDARWRPRPLPGSPPARLRVIGRGDLDQFVLSAEGLAPQPLSLRLRLSEGRKIAQWQLLARSEQLRLGLLGFLPEEPDYTFNLQLDGKGGQARLKGRFARDTFALGLDGSLLRADARGLALAPLALQLAQGPVTAQGRVDFTEKQPRVDLRLRSAGLLLAPASGVGPASTAVMDLRAQGRWQAWTLRGSADLQRDDERAQVQVAGVGDSEHLRIDTLDAKMPTGSLRGRATLRWSPRLGGDADLLLAGFDPGYFVPDFPGAISGRVLLSAESLAQGWKAKLRADKLGGQLRKRALQASAQLDWNDGEGQGELALQLGASRVQAGGRFGRRLDLRASLQPLELSDVWPEARGRLQGRLVLQGAQDAPDVEADLRGSGLRWGDYAAASLSLRGKLPANAGTGQVDASATGLDLAGQSFAEAELHLQGNQRRLQGRARLGGESGELSLAGSAAGLGADWRGRVDSLNIAPRRGAAWHLEQASAWQQGAQGLRFDRSCLRAEDGSGQLCAQASHDQAYVSGRGLRLALIEPWLGERMAPYSSFGELELDGGFARRGAAPWSGQLRLTSASGGLRLRDPDPPPLLAYSGLRAQLDLRDARVTLNLEAALSGGGMIKGSAHAGLAATAPLDGELAVEVRDLTWMELLSPELAAPKGRIAGHLRLSGTRAQPHLGGDARLFPFSAELPGLAVTLRDGDIRFNGAPGEEARITGSLHSGQGVLNVDGTLDLRDKALPLHLNLRGEDVEVSNTADLTASISPDLDLLYRDGRLQLRGLVGLPSARIDLERLDQGIAPSPDVIVLDPKSPTRSSGLVLDTQVTLRLGKDVRLRGFGLDGKVSGELAVLDRPGRAAQANGTLSVTGTYRAYGRPLTIRRANLTYLNAAYDNPILDVLAEHEFEEVTVGVRVRGRALAPETTVTSSPSMSTAEALSWLLLGRPLNTASGSETQQISATALALSAGSSLLAQQLGGRLGLDSAGIVETRALGGSTLLVGKQVSPRLFLSYGVSLIGSGQVLMLKYLLARGLNLSIESSKVETAGAINWRREK